MEKLKRMLIVNAFGKESDDWKANNEREKVSVSNERGGGKYEAI